jgi:hypothetical protein
MSSQIRFQTKKTIALMLTLTMILSMGMTLSQSIEESSNQDQMENSSPSLEVGRSGCEKVYVVNVRFADLNDPHRYTPAQLQTLFDQDVSDFLAVASYDKLCITTTVAQNTFISNFNLGTQGWDFWNEVKNSLDDSTPFDALLILLNHGAWSGQSTIWVHDLGGRYIDTDGDGNVELTHCRDDGPYYQGNLVNGEKCRHRNDVVSLLAHELLHNLLDFNGHGASNYRICHDLMGAGCSTTAQLSGWSRVEMGFLPEKNVVVVSPDSDWQEFKLRPLNLNLLDEIGSSTPTSNQIQVLKVPLSDDGRRYYLLEARPRVTLDDQGNSIPIISEADNLDHTFGHPWTNPGKGLHSEGVMIYYVDEAWDFNPNPTRGAVEPIRVIDAEKSTMHLDDAAFQPGQSYAPLADDLDEDGSPDCYYCVQFKVTDNSPVNSNYFVEIAYTTPAMGNSAGPPDLFITPTPTDGFPISVDIWIDSPTNNYDYDNADGDGDDSTGIDAVYKWHVPGDKMSPSDGFSDPPAFDEWNWIYARVKNIGDSAINPDNLAVGFSYRRPSASGPLPNEFKFFQGEGWMAKGPEVICPPQGGQTFMLYCEKNDPDSPAHITYDSVSGTGQQLPELVNPDLVPLDGQFYLYPGEEFIVGHAWKPQASDYPEIDTSVFFEEGNTSYITTRNQIHLCLDVRAFPVPGEPSSSPDPIPSDWYNNFGEYYPNNWAYENVGYFEISKGSPYQIMNGEFDVSNTLPLNATIDIEIVDVPDEWTFTLWPDSVFLLPNEKATFNYSIVVDESWPLGSFDGLVLHAYAETIVDGDYHRFPLSGGLALTAASVERITIDVDDPVWDGEVIHVQGELTSQHLTSRGENFENARVTLKYYSPSGGIVLKNVAVENVASSCTVGVDRVPCAVGVFQADFIGTDEVPLEDGDWNVKIIYDGSVIHRRVRTTNQSVSVIGVEPPQFEPPDTVIPGIGGDDSLGGNETKGSSKTPSVSALSSLASFCIAAIWFSRRD